MSFTSTYLTVHEDQSQVLPFLARVQQEIHVLEPNEVGSLVSYLLADLDIKPQKAEWDELVITQAVLTLKFLGRRVDDCEMLYKKQGIFILLKLSGLVVDENDKLVDISSSQEALKCIANCILLRGEVVKQTLMESKRVIATCARLVHEGTISVETKFLICRILYLMTSVDGPCIIDTLMNLKIPDAIAKILHRYDRQWLHDPSTMAITADTESNSSPLQHPTTLVSEALKLQGNLMIALQETETGNDYTYREDDDPDRVDNEDSALREQVAGQFSECLAPILDILFVLPYPSPLPLVASSPFTNALQVLNFYTLSLIRDTWAQSATLQARCPYPKASTHRCVETFVKVLEQTLLYLMPPRPSSFNGNVKNKSSLAGGNSRPSSVLFSTPLDSLSGSCWKPRQPCDADLDRDMATVLSLLIAAMTFARHLYPSLRNYIVPLPLNANIFGSDDCHNEDEEGDVEKNEEIKQRAHTVFTRLVKLLSSTRFPQSKEMTGELLFAHVNENASLMVKLVGYENAVDFLTRKGCDLQLLKKNTEESADNHNNEADAVQEALLELTDMTDEEKEREAERLFVMFERVQLHD